MSTKHDLDPGSGRSAHKAHKFNRVMAERRACEETKIIDHLAAELRLASFRTYLAATVRSMSSLVLPALAAENIYFDAALALLQPSFSWPKGRMMAREYRVHRPLSPASPRAPAIWKSFDRWTQGSVMVRDSALGFGRIVLGVMDHSVEVSIEYGTFALKTEFGTARIRTDQQLPEVAATACIGRPVEDVLDHPLLRARGFVIANVVQTRPLGDSTIFEIEVGEREVRIPRPA